MPSKEFKELTGNTASTILALNVTDSEKEEFEQTLSDYCENTGEITYVSRDYYKAMFDGEKQMFVCVCGYREKLADFRERRASSGANQREVQKYLANQDQPAGSSAMADAMARWLEANKKDR